MSRRGQARAAAAADPESDTETDAHNTLEAPDVDASDPVINAIRFGMDSIMKIVNDTVPQCPADDEELRESVANRMEASLLQLVEAELAYSQTSTIVNQVVDELNLQDNPDMDTKEFLDAVDSINDLAHQRIAEYKETLTEDVLRSHPTFLRMKRELEALLDEDPRGDDLDEPGLEDAETEAEEVDLDDSTVGDVESHEVIPELDPISKQPLKDPVRNRHCRHIYGKAAMLQLIKKNSKTRCPAMGCNNKEFVKAKDLVSDPKLTAKVTGKAGSSSSVPETPSPGPSSAKKGKGRKPKRGRRR